MQFSQPIRNLILAAGIVLAVILTACGGESGAKATTAPTAASATAASATAAPTKTQPTAAPTAASAGIKLLDATFARKLDENQAPIDPTDTFGPTDQINLSLKFDGRPKQGVVKTRFMFQDQLIAEAQVDFAQANSGVIFSVGEATYTGFFLTPNQPFPASDTYHADVTVNDKPLGSYKFKIVAPETTPTDAPTKAPTDAPTEAPTSAAGEAFTFGKFKLYTHPKGYFSIMLPAAWQIQDRSSQDEGIMIGAQEPEGRGLVMVHLIDVEHPTDGDTLKEVASNYAERYFGNLDNYKLLRAAAQDDTSAAAGYTFTMDINGAKMDMAAMTNVVRKDNRVGFLSIIVPLSETKNKAVQDAIGTISGSFGMNSALPLPQ